MVLNQALQGESADQVFVEAFKLQICRCDIATLSGRKWLNDMVVGVVVVVGCWRGYVSGERYRFAYGPADATATHYLSAENLCVSCDLHFYTI